VAAYHPGMTDITLLQALGLSAFALAVLHTFAAPWLAHLAHAQPRHAGLWHLLGEVEVVFGVWAMLLMLLWGALAGSAPVLHYIDSRNFTEPLFVFAIMVVAATRPVLVLAQNVAVGLARRLPLPQGMALYGVVLMLVPLLGSFITEPAAMTLAALLLRDTVLAQPVSSRLKYATLGVLFVNVSIGGTLTPFAAPPVLMVAGVWQWDMGFMLHHFGGKAALAVAVNSLGAMWLFRRELAALPAVVDAAEDEAVSWVVTGVHLAFLVGVVLFAHHPAVFMGLLLFFLGYTTAYPRDQSPLILREALLVAFFLAGLVVLGGLQAWWLKPILQSLDATQVFWGVALLTAFTDNAALTYLGSLVPGLSQPFQIALVAGAVTGGGLTVIANAPNPAGVALLRCRFDDATIAPLGLLLGALPPTLVAALALRLL
jgi:hypothetical protein